MADSPLAGVSGPLGVTVKLAGTALADDIAILSVRTQTEINRIPQAIVTLADGDVASGEVPVTDGTLCVPGTEIEVAAYFGSDPESVIFKGIVTATRLRFSGGSGQLELTCTDKAVALTGIRKTASFVAVKDSDVMSQIIGDAGLTADVATTTADAADIIQYDSPDWDFLRILADRNGHVIFVDDGTVKTAEPDPSTGAVMTLTLGTDILDFDAAVDTRGLFASTSVSGWDPASQAVTVETSDAADTGQWGNSTFADLTSVTDDRAHSTTTPYSAGQVDLATTATARAARAALATITGSCRYPGSTLATTGDTIELTGVGDRMGGTAYVCGITHDLRDGEWTTSATLGLPASWRSDSFAAAAPGAGGLTAPVQGLHVATVLSIVDSGGANPMADDTMIQISLPLMGDTPAELWARYAQPYASSGAGIQFLPEVGDEVIVGFLSADPGAPVVLGALHSSSNARTNEATEENELKTITSKSGIHITFDDDLEVLTAETPAGQSIVLDDDGSTITLTDVTGNTVTMSDSGIAIAAEGTLDLTATGNITIASDQDVDISGMNVGIAADVELTAEGSASAGFSSSGQTTIEGSIVMIN